MMTKTLWALTMSIFTLHSLSAFAAPADDSQRRFDLRAKLMKISTAQIREVLAELRTHPEQSANYTEQGLRFSFTPSAANVATPWDLIDELSQRSDSDSTALSIELAREEFPPRQTRLARGAHTAHEGVADLIAARWIYSRDPSVKATIEDISHNAHYSNAFRIQVAHVLIKRALFVTTGPVFARRPMSADEAQWLDQIVRTSATRSDARLDAASAREAAQLIAEHNKWLATDAVKSLNLHLSPIEVNAPSFGIAPTQARQESVGKSPHTNNVIPFRSRTQLRMCPALF